MTTRRELLKGAVAAGIAAALLRPTAGISQAGNVDRTRSPTTGIAQTVLGPLDASNLGFTLSHEHIADGPNFFKRWPRAWGGKDEYVARTVEKLRVVRDAGVNTIVDLTPYDTGRDIRFLEEASRKSGLHMIACTGQRFLPPNSDVSMPARTIEGLGEYFAKEIEQGMDGTDIKAGVIKIGVVGNHPTALEEIGLRAAARASRATGVPIRVHTDAAHRAGVSAAAILENEGVSPVRVSFDHSDDSGDIDYFLGLVKRGYSLSMDHVHRGLIPGFKPSFERRVECIKQLVDAGFADRIFLSQDTGFGASLLPEEKRDWRDKLDSPDGLLFTTHRLIPRLEEIGVSSGQMRVITVENPRHFFGKAHGYSFSRPAQPER